MNFNVGGPSVHRSLSSSSDDDNPLGLSNEEYQTTLQILSTNNMMTNIIKINDAIVALDMVDRF